MTTVYPFSAHGRPRSADPLPPGVVLRSRFVIIRLITSTALSYVYLGHDQLTNRAVAIKQPVAYSGQDGVEPTIALRLFQREAYILRRLRHPQIPDLIAAFRDHSSVFLAIEHFAGITLEQRLSQGALPFDEALAIAYELCRVVDHLHRQTPSIIHADIKPGNIMLSEDKQVVLLDYGLARPRDLQKLANPAVGTPGYTPPEQWRGEPLDQRSDIYALGMVLREMFSASATPAVQQALVRATATDAGDRFATVAQLYRALNRPNQPGKRWPRHMGGHESTVLHAFNMLVALVFIGIVFIRIAYEAIPTPAIAIQKPATQVISLSSIPLPTPGKSIDSSAMTMARITLFSSVDIALPLCIRRDIPTPGNGFDHVDTGMSACVTSP